MVGVHWFFPRDVDNFLNFSFENWFLVGFIWMGLLAFVSTRGVFSVCPKCNRLFHYGFFNHPWTNKCVHCGLELDLS